MMRRPFLLCSFFFSAGIITAYYLSWISILLIFPLILVIAFYCRKIKLLIIFIIVFILGFSWISWHEYIYSNDASIISYNGQDNVDILGVIKEDLRALSGNKVYLKPYFADGNRIKYGLIELDKRYLPHAVEDGDLVSGVFNLSFPSKAMNPGGFSNYNYLKRRGVFSKGYLSYSFTKISRVNGGILKVIIKAKRAFIKLINQTMDFPYNEVLKGLLLGEKSGIPAEWTSNFELSGANHLLAISGLHVGVISLIFLKILKLCRLPVISRNIIITLLMIFYIVLTGFRPSVLRAGILVITFLWAVVFKRSGEVFNLIGLSSMINLVINPYDLFNVGFQLSYMVLSSIVLWTNLLKNKLPNLLALSIAAQLGASPLIAYYFNLLTPIGVVTNLWAIPLSGIIVSLGITGLLLGIISPVISWLINSFISYLLFVLNWGTSFMAGIPLGHLEVATPSIVITILFILFILIMPIFLKKRYIPLNIKKQKKIILYLIYVMLFFLSIELVIPFFNNHLEVTFLSVGQGDSIVINVANSYHLVVDGGGRAGLASTQGQVTVLPYLIYKGIKKIDVLYITHFDGDHALGIIDLIGQREIGLLVLPACFDNNDLAKEVIKKAWAYNIPVKLSSRGDLFKLGKCSLTVLNPLQDLKFPDRNNNSVVLKVNYGNFSLLLTGDLEKEGEYRLIESGDFIKSNVLKLGHHGSAGSSSELFLRKVEPDYAVISVGRNNYGHPAQEVFDRTNKFNIKTLRTDKSGAITITTNGKQYKIKSYR
ncbi:DNA internalization-related competence protein ComEC/Rec2 [Iocasia frigidifontis]|uniref:DNA internalization-related competence protein ComEC/Rec2 n=2 Tax=Iocasia fonsfrigidae TaxID=2682810 RepID=A0A8A7K900_9FIRM|nr:DNA internalization-related competence protein ComEC/Rec2 [Iocasia fonsfrigidae]